MLTSENLYWITRMDSIKCLMEVMGGFFLILVFFMLLFFPMITDLVPFKIKILVKVGIGFFLVGTFLLLLAIFIPTTKEFAFIYVAPKIANSDIAKELGRDFIELKGLAIEYMKENLKK